MQKIREREGRSEAQSYTREPRSHYFPCGKGAKSTSRSRSTVTFTPGARSSPRTSVTAPLDSTPEESPFDQLASGFPSPCVTEPECMRSIVKVVSFGLFGPPWLGREELVGWVVLPLDVELVSANEPPWTSEPRTDRIIRIVIVVVSTVAMLEEKCHTEPKPKADTAMKRRARTWSQSS